MKFESATIKDIAKALNLSTSTVSRALRGSYEISAETKKQVLEYAEKINYRPNPIALSLKERRTRSIGIVVSEIANNFFFASYQRHRIHRLQQRLPCHHHTKP